MKHLEFEKGDRMPALGLGTWKSAPGEVGAAVVEAIRVGYRHIDCAAIYGNEKEVGDALVRAIDSGLVERDDLWVTSKLWCNRHARDEVVPAIQESIAALQCQYLDLYLVHWPVAVQRDVLGPKEAADFHSLEEMPLLDTWAGMEDAAELGLARHVGVSNYSAKKLETHLGARIRPEVDQVELHPYLQQTALVRFATEHGIHMTGYSPLGSGDRPDSLKPDGEPVLLQDGVLGEIARRHDATIAQVLLGWAMQRGTSVIPKSVNPERIAENFESAALVLDDAAMGEIAALDRARRYIDGAFWAKPGGPYTVAGLWD